MHPAVANLVAYSVSYVSLWQRELCRAFISVFVVGVVRVFVVLPRSCSFRSSSVGEYHSYIYVERSFESVGGSFSLAQCILDLYYYTYICITGVAIVVFGFCSGRRILTAIKHQPAYCH